MIKEFLFLMCLLVTYSVLGCGTIPSGQERILRFSVNRFMPALPMVYIENPASRSVYPSVSENAMAAQRFVLNLIMRAVNEVLEQQGRSAGLSYDVITTILDQLTVNVTYDPLKCYSVSSFPIQVAQDALRKNGEVNCLVARNTVTSSCNMMAMANCAMPSNMNAIPPQHLTLSGTLKIRNLIMATWSNQMWRTILNRVLRVLSSGPFGRDFQSASVDIV